MAVSIEFCASDAAAEVQAFIHDHWNPGHVLARSSALLDWQHGDPAAKRYNFLLARDEDAGIVGLLGFIPTSRYDPDLANGNETLWLTTWKVREGYAHGLGLLLLRTLTTRLRPAWIGTVGLNPATRGIYAALGYKVGTLTRHALLNEALVGRRLAQLPPGGSVFVPTTGSTALKPLSAQTFWAETKGLGLDQSEQVPRKSLAYLYNRYVRHPFYAYQLYLAVDGRAAAVIAVRACRHDDAVALRVVDVLGNPAALVGCGPAFRCLLDEAEAEYIDFYCSGFEESLAAAGFRPLRAEDDLILPGHFEPFEQRNVTLLYSLQGRDGPIVICKGDADQDRPNFLEEGAA